MVKIRMTHVCFCAVTTLFGCGRAPEPAAQRPALVQAPAEATPTSRVAIERSIDTFTTERERVEDPDARWALRLWHYEQAQITLRRGSVDDSGLMASLGELRRAFMGGVEMQADYDAHEAARIERGERIELTPEDHEQARQFAASGERDRVLSARQTEVRAARRDDIARSEAYVDVEPTGGVDLAAILRGERPEVPVNTVGVQQNEEAPHAR